MRLGQVPEHQFALWNRYDVSDRFGLGLGVTHQSSQFAAIRTGPATTELPAFTRFDAAVFFDVSERLAASKQLKQPQDAELIRQYSDPVWVLGTNWNPKEAAIFKSFPIGTSGR